MCLSTKGLIYWSRRGQTDLLGACRYVDLGNILNECEVVTLECNLWRLHFEDKFEGYRVNLDRLAMGNRFPFGLVEWFREREG